MSSTQSASPRRGGEVRTLGHFLPRMVADLPAELIRDLRGSEALRAYGEEVAGRLTQRRWPTSLAERQVQGGATRKRVLMVLEQLALRGTVTVPVTRAQWLRLLALAKFCVRPQDWASASGPIIGAGLATLSEYLGVKDVSEAVEPLLRHGLLCSWRPRANGRRSFRLIGEKSDRERVLGSGWSLAPLVLGLDALEALLIEETAWRRAARRVPGEIRRLLQAVGEDLAGVGNETRIDLELAAADLDRQARDIRPGDIAALHGVRDACCALHDRASGLLSVGPTPDSSPLQPGENPPHNYNPDPQDSVRSGLAGGASGDEPPALATPAPAAIADKGELGGAASHDTDPFGIEAAGFSVYEIPVLFPGLAAFTGEDPREIGRAMPRLAAGVGVPITLVQRVAARHGGLAALLMLLITGHRLGNGEIRTSPTAYYAGLLRKAERGDLNLGHTLFALRRGSEALPADLSQQRRRRH